MIRGVDMLSLLKRGKALYFVLAGFLVILFFQNCSPVAVQDTTDPSLIALLDTQELEAVLGDESTIPPLKLFFVVDNSNTMAANNIALAQSFQEMFKGSEASSLSKFDTSVYLMSTAQNIFAGAEPSSIGSEVSRSSPIVSQYLSRNLASWSKKTTSEINTERAPLNSGRISGDLLGFEFIAKKNVISTAADDIAVLPVPTVDFKNSNGGEGLTAVLGIHKPRGGSIEELSREVSERLKTLNPNGYVKSVIDQNDIEKARLTVSEESGLCAISRVLKNHSRFMANEDQAAFVVVSDEDDMYSHGKNCIDGFRSELAPNQPLIGTCQGKKTQFSFTHPVTNIKMNAVRTKLNFSIKKPDSYRFSYSLTSGGSPASCKARYYTDFQVSYNIYPIQTRIKYYTYSVADEIKTYSNQLEKIVSAQDLSSCTEAALVPHLGNSNFVEYAVAGYKPSCTLEVLTSASPIAQSKTLNYSLIKPESPAINSDCSPQVVSKLTISPANRLVSGSCKITQIYLKESTSAVLATGGSSADCSTVTQNFCATVLPASASGGVCNEANRVVYTAAVLPTTTVKNDLSVPTSSMLTCDSACSSTSLCSSTSFASVKDYLASRHNTVVSNISNCSVSSTMTVGATSSLSRVDKSSSLACDSQCALSKDICPSKGTKTVKEFLEETYKGTVTNCLRSDDAIAVYDTNHAESLTCDQSCAGSLICANSPTLNVEQHLRSTASLVGYDVVSCQALPQAQGRVDISKNEELSCSMPCSGTSLCVSSADTVEKYLAQTESALRNKAINSCAASVVANTPYSVNKVGATINTICAANEIFTPDVNSSPTMVPKVDFVSSGQNGQPMDLVSYIQSQQKLLFGDTQFLYSAFVVRNEAERNASLNQSIGTKYIQLADSVGGSVYPVNATSYAPALKDLSAVIKKKLDRTVVFKELMGNEKIVAVWLRKSQDSNWQRLTDGAQWSAAGRTVTLDPSVQFEFGDSIKINYK